MSARERESRLRSEALRRRDHLVTVLGRLLGAEKLVAGSIYSRRRRCGKPQCRCVRGQLHEDRVLAVRRAGRVAVRCLDPVEDTATEEAVIAWRLFRRRRHEMVETCQALLRAVDRLGHLRQAMPGGLA